MRAQGQSPCSNSPRPKAHRAARRFAAARGNPRGKTQMKRSRFHADLGTDGVLELVIYGDIVEAVTAGSLESWGYDPSSFVSPLSVKKAVDSAAGACSKIRLRI